MNLGPFKHGLGLLALTALLAGCGRAPEDPFPEPESMPEVQARVSDSTPRVGDVVDVHIRLSAYERLPSISWRDHLHPELTALDTPRSEETETDERWIRDIRLPVALYDVTTVTLFENSTLTLPGEEDIELPLPWVEIDVRALVEGEDAAPNPGDFSLMDFRGPDAIRRQRRNMLISLLTLVVITALILFGWRRAKQRPGPPPPPPKWDEIALKKMRELRASDIWTSGNIDASAVALSQILRDFIEQRYHIHAPELTTEEFLMEASNRQPWPEDTQHELEGFFVAVDKIKFAGERPETGVLEDLMEAAERFVCASGSPPSEGGAA